MKVAISATSKFHSFDLAREMHARGALAGIFSGYPRFKLRNEGLPRNVIHTFPYVHATQMVLSQVGLLGADAMGRWEHFDFATFDAHVAEQLPDCDVFVGQSGSALLTGRAARRRGIWHVCDRGPAHVRVQDRLLREEHERWGIPFAGIDQRVIEREETEYAEADRITVPSSFALASFVAQGVPGEKLRMLPYGVNLAQFCPAGEPDPTRFDVLFSGTVSLQKGIPYLLQAFARLEHPRKSLTLAGSPGRDLIAALRWQGLSMDKVRVVGHVPQSQLKFLISRSHVLVLPSIQDGFGLVLAEAMACACVVIGTNHTGAPDLVTEGQDGFVIPVRDSDALANRLQYLADHPERRAEMGRKALQRVSRDRGWRNYGEKATLVYREALCPDSRRMPVAEAGSAREEVSRILFFESHPVQYKAPVYMELNRLLPDAFEVVYATDASLRPDNLDAEFGKRFAWDTPLLEGYRYRVLGNETRLPFGSPKSLSGRGVFSLLRREHPRAIVLTSLRYHVDLVAYLSALLLRIPILIRQETQDEMFAGRRTWLMEVFRYLAYRAIYAAVRHAFAFGKLNYAHLRRHGIPEQRISFARFSVVNSVERLSDFERTAMRDDLRQRFGISADRIVLGFVGKFIEKKNPDLLFRALEHLPPEPLSRLHLLFVGSGKLQQDLEQLANTAQYRWGVRSTFAGFVNQSQLAPYYLATDILALPSRRMGEAWGLVVNEALNAGCAVVISEAVGCRTEFEDLERVRTIAVESEHGFARAFAELAEFRRDFRWAEARMQNYTSAAAAEAIRDALVSYLRLERYALS